MSTPHPPAGDGVDAGSWSGTLDEAAMTQLARDLAGAVRPPLTFWFEGDLGAGKTTFIRAFLQALGHPGRVKSPTYGLLEHYTLPTAKALHLDLYRIGDAEELEFLGLADLLDEDTLLLVEWPERGRGFLPEPDLVLTLGPAQNDSANARHLSVYAHSRSGNALCEFINSLL